MKVVLREQSVHAVLDLCYGNKMNLVSPSRRLIGVGVNELRPRRRLRRPLRLRKARTSRAAPSMGMSVDEAMSLDSSTDSDCSSTMSSLDKSPSVASKDLGFSDCPSPLLGSERSWGAHPPMPPSRALLLLRRREGLLDITVRTVALMRRNQQLQHRLAALQAETRAFVRSVLNNPENRGLNLAAGKRRRDSSGSEDDDDDEDEEEEEGRRADADSDGDTRDSEWSVAQSASDREGSVGQ